MKRTIITLGSEAADEQGGAVVSSKPRKVSRVLSLSSGGIEELLDDSQGTNKRARVAEKAYDPPPALEQSTSRPQVECERAATSGGSSPAAVKEVSVVLEEAKPKQAARRARATHAEEGQEHAAATPTKPSIEPSITTGSAQRAQTGLAGLTTEERARMEEARRARAAAATTRNGWSPSPSPSLSFDRRPGAHKGFATLGSPLRAPPKPAVKHGLFFPKAEVRRTTNCWYPDEDSLSMEQILGEKSAIHSIISAAYTNDVEWLRTVAFAGIRKVTLISGKRRGRSGSHPVTPGDYSFCQVFPAIDMMHMKFFVIFAKTFTRVAIWSANNLAYDYSVAENAAWIRDFPLRATECTNLSFYLTDFGRTWERTLTKCGVDDAHWRKQMEATDFGGIDDECRLVLSWPDDAQSGHLMLAEQLRDMGLATPVGHTLEVEYQTSSVGSYTHHWLEQFYSSLTGADPSSKKRFATPQDVPLHVLFPSYEHVKRSRRGIKDGAMLFASQEHFCHAFAQSNVREAISKRQGVLSHNKMMVALFKPCDSSRTLPPGSAHGWAYVGSHNLTPAAWGNMLNGRLHVMNAELGVIWKLEAESYDAAEKQADQTATWQRPVQPYEAGARPRIQELYQAGAGA